MIYHIVFKMVVTSKGQEKVVIREAVKGASDSLVIFHNEFGQW